MDTQPMSQERFLELLNKPDKSPEEVQELNAELKRQDDKAAQTPSQEVTPEPQPEAAPPAEEEKKESSQAEAVQDEPAPAQDVPVAPVPEAVEEAPYSFETLAEETQEAINFLRGKDRTLAVEMAIAAFESATYWTKLAHEGK